MAVLMATALVLPQGAWANVNSVTPVPSVLNIPVKGAGTVSVIWQVQRIEAGGGGTVTVTSPGALLQVNGTTIATLAGTLSQSSTLPNGASTTLNLSETLPISAALAREIANAPSGAVTLQRLFTDTQRSSIGVAGLAPTLGNASEVAVSRIELSFENSARTDVIYKGDPLRAVVDVTFRGNGLLRGEWRLVDPTASLGSSRGRVLQVVRQQLVSSGEGRQRILSPPLPTDVNGLYLLAFSVEDTTAGFEIPILRYFVIEGQGAAEPLEMRALSPTNGASLNDETVFAWQALRGADAYQIEIMDHGENEVITAKLVPASETKLTLSALSFEDLTSGHGYDWRIRGFDNGQVVGLSQRRLIIVP